MKNDESGGILTAAPALLLTVQLSTVPLHSPKRPLPHGRSSLTPYNACMGTRRPMIEWNDEPKRGNRAFQFSLKGLLIACAMLSLPGWYMASERAVVRERKEARKWIKSRYASREHHRTCGNMPRINPSPLRAWLGDEVVFGFTVPNLSESERVWLAELFPEASVWPPVFPLEAEPEPLPFTAVAKRS